MKMEISLPQEKLVKPMPQCKQVAESKEIIIVDLTKLIGKLGSTAQAILPAQIQVRYLQGFQIQALKLSKCYHVKVHIDQVAKEELFWWIENLRLYNGKSLILLPADLGISTDASTKGWVATCQGISTGGPWSEEEQKAHINILELKAVHLAILTFAKIPNSSEDTCPDGQQNSFELPGKDGGTHNKDPLGLSKQIWDYLHSKKITTTAEYLPVHLNVTADWESHDFQDKSDWKLSPEVLAKICQKLGTPSIDLFASQMSHQLPVYMAWKPDPGSQATNAMYQPWTKMFPYAFPPFSLIPPRVNTER